MKPTEAWAVVLPDGDLASLDLSNNQTSARADTLRYDDARVARVLITEGWRPIAEAGRGPNDFWWAFCPMPWRCPAEYRQIYWCDGQWVNAENDEPLKYQPTHFMPLPAPPVDRAATEVKRG